jgi:tetratricopeptide (TPR) repeat protein
MLTPVLFDEIWDYQDPAGTEAELRRLVPAAEAEHDLSYRLQLFTQIARAQGLQREFDAARTTLQAVEEELDDAPPVARVRWLLEFGRLENSSGSPEGSAPYFREAWALATAESLDFYAVDAAHMLGIVEEAPAAQEWTRKALSLAEESEDPMARRWRGSLANNLGWTLFEEGRHEEALALFEDALAFRRDQGKVREIRIAEWCVAKTWRVLGRVDEALAAQQALLEAYETDGVPSDGYVEEEIAECLLALDRPDEAAPWFRNAWEKLAKDPWLAEAEPERLDRMKRLAGPDPD